MAEGFGQGYTQSDKGVQRGWCGRELMESTPAVLLWKEDRGSRVWTEVWTK